MEVLLTDNSSWYVGADLLMHLRQDCSVIPYSRLPTAVGVSSELLLLLLRTLRYTLQPRSSSRGIHRYIGKKCRPRSRVMVVMFLWFTTYTQSWDTYGTVEHVHVRSWEYSFKLWQEPSAVGQELAEELLVSTSKHIVLNTLFSL